MVNRLALPGFRSVTLDAVLTSFAALRNAISFGSNKLVEILSLEPLRGNKPGTLGWRLIGTKGSPGSYAGDSTAHGPKAQLATP
jgi:hypothetical protein